MCIEWNVTERKVIFSLVRRRCAKRIWKKKKTTKNYNNNKQRTMITRRTMRGLTGRGWGAEHRRRHRAALHRRLHFENCKGLGRRLHPLAFTLYGPGITQIYDSRRHCLPGSVSLCAFYARAEQYRKGSTSPLLPLPESLSLLSLLLCYFFFFRYYHFVFLKRSAIYDAAHQCHVPVTILLYLLCKTLYAAVFFPVNRYIFTFKIGWQDCV